jgi:predicted dehydrogenase
VIVSAPAPLGVGFVGCGAAVQSFHAATIDSLPELFRVRHCMDPDEEVAREVARRFGARSTTDLSAVLSDGSVDVVVIASPASVHAEQVIAACEAGKRAVLCEKPLAEGVADTERIASASERSGVPVVVGTMHRYDPTLRELERAWGDLPQRAHLIRCHAFVEPNAWLVDAATELLAPGPPPARTATPPDVAQQVARPPLELLMFAGLMWGLAIHDLPLVGLGVSLADLEVVSAVPTATSGYFVSMRAGHRVVQLASMLNQYARTEWSFELIADDGSALVEFPTGYLATRSTTAVLSRSNGLLDERRFGGSNETGYRAQYRHLADVARGDASPMTSIADALDHARLIERLVRAAHQQWPS